MQATAVDAQVFNRAARALKKLQKQNLEMACALCCHPEIQKTGHCCGCSGVQQGGPGSEEAAEAEPGDGPGAQGVQPSLQLLGRPPAVPAGPQDRAAAG